MSLAQGGGGLGKKMTKCDKGGRGVEPKSDVTHPKKNLFQISFCIAADDAFL